ncbi:crossover junction endodeoxyribonuclease RuvC [Candidatus Giovannonibacteria bacterium RIFCSPLOWO2_01_FULL_44_40]|uniref:Crossover junction endodeoxyribonuclease RuvC n=1 Tax=Candidatus Giovannonibacteria bacterium RIFCSPHIGHO2_01_FULL_45_23 TaxID=1798325 RepID=A0A1F5VJ79_9BACT|nr:MAG: crossover junction endodeoxyribonuclease RuvC [Candidatus Giovannonibacteria bacterium RIFCSPHIGHO2_01_FULL_45_23]OGF75604.1 MAG: crossover junction endodeoxyribonuclease RuvC [Candidatus Giovannonibacteria bacterium RIFCSPHIGHO2_02_FULL_45_13]OGF80111.1 MAG: crossover junction endodeoxyribonuclease RuvC [Candidatus Giovannonibacteria bacterium RIFCSPLOWO2_01_FULL_44_40]
MKILGIDPGIERLGWGLVEKSGSKFARIVSGVKQTSKNQRESERLWEIFEFLDDLIKKTKPDILSTEKLFFAKNVKTALIIGEVRGIILAAAEKHELPIKEFTPLAVKMAVCGYGRAGKESVANMIKIQLNLPKNKLLDDETDALALALTAFF